MLTLERTGRARKALIWTLLAVWALLAMQTAPRRSFAQDADKAATDKAPEKAAEPAAAAGAATRPRPPEEPEDSIFLWVIRVSGLIGLVILCLSIYFVATVGRLFIEMRPVVAMPPEIIARCEALLEQRDFKSIYGVVKDDNSFFSTRAFDRHRRIAQRLGRGPRGDGKGRRVGHRRNGKENQHAWPCSARWGR